MMRRTPALLALLLLPLAALAQPAERCASKGIQLFPAPGSVIPTNSRIILEGLGPDQARVRSLRALKLKADDDSVTMRVTKVLVGGMNRTAVMLRPRAILKPNRVYRLMLDEQLPNFTLLGPAGPSTDLPAWRTGKGPDDRAPKWLDKPSVSEGEHRVVDQKLIRNVKLRMSMQEESPAYLLVSIGQTRGSSRALQTYFAPIRGGEAIVGHDGCSGGFTFEDGRAYRATIQGYDVAGNLAPRVSPIEFHAPRPIRR